MMYLCLACMYVCVAMHQRLPSGQCLWCVVLAKDKARRLLVSCFDACAIPYFQRLWAHNHASREELAVMDLMVEGDKG